MITRKELGYVKDWANKVPYPGMEYAEEAMKKLQAAIDYFNKFYNNKQYELILSNGEEFSFEILNKNLCHLLGIDYKNISSDYCDSYRERVLKIDYIPKSYELLLILLDHLDDVLKYDYDNGGKIINYYRVMVKCAIFEKLSDFSRFNFGVINFDKNIFLEKSAEPISCKSSKFLYGQSGERSVPYFMMGVLEDNGISNTYVAETLLAPTDPSGFFNSQEVAIPTQILVTTEDKMEKVVATAHEKIALLSEYRSIIKNNGIPNCMNIFGDYENMLSEEANIKRKVK